MPNPVKRERWVVARFGAYMHYAVPRILNNAGLLARLYTDFYASAAVRKVLSMVPEGWRNSTINRALGRYAADLPSELIRSYPLLGLQYSIAQRLLRDPEARDALFLRTGEKFGRAIARDGFAGANGLYCFNTAALHALRAAKEKGLKCVLDQTIAPRIIEERLLAEEQEKFKDWEPARRCSPAVESTIRREAEEWDLADTILCPSDFVRQSIIDSGVMAHKCILVPYGVDKRFLSIARPTHGGPLRVLIVGQVNLRKGAGYACEVGRILGRAADLRWVGPILLTAKGRRELEQHVQLTGTIPRNQIFEQFRWADVFFLPSVCEGSATVIYEALMSGLPVVTTSNAGSIVADGINGFIVPIRDAKQMAEKLQHLRDDDQLCHNMQQQVTATSWTASFESYQKRLLDALASISNEITV